MQGNAELVCCFTVYGKPETAGSKQSFVPLGKDKQPFRRPNGGVVVSTVDANPKSKGWKRQVGAEAAKAMRDSGLQLEQGPLRVEFVFYRLRPASHYGAGKNAEQLKKSAPRFPASKPDVLKLARAVEDGMNGIVYKDDALIVDEHLVKRFGDMERVEITVWRA